MDRVMLTQKPKPAPESIWGSSSLKVRAFKARYSEAGLAMWNTNRVAKLCRALKWTPWMLCAWAGMFKLVFHEDSETFDLELNEPLIKRCWDRDDWPVMVTVQFANIEAFLAEQPAPQSVAFGESETAV